jgi:hypothetical protein
MKWLLYFIGKLWDGLGDDAKFTVWVSTWMVPMLLASCLDSKALWIFTAVIGAADIVWFLYDTYVEAIQKGREIERKKLKQQSHEVLRLMVLERDDIYEKGA